MSNMEPVKILKPVAINNSLKGKEKDEEMVENDGHEMGSSATAAI